jgi:hypothetical protein
LEFKFTPPPQPLLKFESVTDAGKVWVMVMFVCADDCRFCMVVTTCTSYEHIFTLEPVTQLGSVEDTTAETWSCCPCTTEVNNITISVIKVFDRMWIGFMSIDLKCCKNLRIDHMIDAKRPGE